MKGKHIALAGLLLSACAQTQGRDFYADRISKISDIEVILNTYTKTINPNEKEEPFSHEKKGSGFVVGNYVFTVDHVVSKHSITYPTPYGPATYELDRIDEKTFIDELQVHPVIEDRQKDIAIFDLRKTEELCEIYCNDLTLEDIASSEELYPGLKVYWMASPQLRGTFYRSSHVASIREVRDYNEEGVEKFLDNSFSLNIGFRSGTSGKPVWAEINGKTKIVGVGHFQLDGLGFAKLMDEYIEIINEYEEGEI